MEAIKPRLFHVSETAAIARFEPRPNYRVAGQMVWAVDEAHLVNFLVPRDCPRITYGRGATTTEADAARFLGEVRLLAALAAAGAEVRVLQDFWPLCDAVANSSLEFSIIHKDRAQPRSG